MTLSTFKLITLVLFMFSFSLNVKTQTVGLLKHNPGTFDGYTMLAKLGTTYLMDQGGQVVHTWQTGSNSTHPGYLLENGDLLTVFKGIKRLSWEGAVIWEYTNLSAHHDVAMLPNGNVLLLIWGNKTREQALAAGRNPDLLTDDIDPLVIHEVTPNGDVVWEWHVWDHLIQDFDPMQDNYGVVADHPELVDINFTFRTVADWLHSNAIDYNAELDQIMISPRFNSEIWIIDHSTTTEQAASHSGGNAGKGGDLLYRWGNPIAYRAGTAENQQTYGSHDAHWIAEGLPGAGNILLFNNGGFDYGRDGDYSTIDEFTPPLNGYNYDQNKSNAFLPESPGWTFIANPREDFYSSYISSVQRLNNGNTFIDEGAYGYLFEVNSSGEVIWQYQSPIDNSGILSQGDSPPAVRQGSLFRAYKYDKNFPAFENKAMYPLGPIELYEEYWNLLIISPENGLIKYPSVKQLTVGEGQLIPLIATESSNYIFENWSVTAGNAMIQNPLLKHTTVKVVNGPITIEANYTFDGDLIFNSGFEFSSE